MRARHAKELIRKQILEEMIGTAIRRWHLLYLRLPVRFAFPPCTLKTAVFRYVDGKNKRAAGPDGNRTTHPPPAARYDSSHFCLPFAEFNPLTFCYIQVPLYLGWRSCALGRKGNAVKRKEWVNSVPPDRIGLRRRGLCS